MDIWSLGIILYEILYEKLPWETNDVVEEIKNFSSTLMSLDMGFHVEPPAR